MRFGFSVSAHYRLLKTPQDIEKLLRGIVSLPHTTSCELSFFDEESVEMFAEGYLNAYKYFKTSAIQDIAIHFLRKGITEENFLAVSEAVKEIAEIYSVREIVVHYDMYVRFKELFHEVFVDAGYILLIEHSDFSSAYNNTEAKDINEDADIKAVTLDVCHFDFENTESLETFILLNKDKVKEVHFAYKNHNLFTAMNLDWIQERFDIVLKHLDTDSVRFVCEGTAKDAENIEVVLKTLQENSILLSTIIPNK